uniref:DUF4842 domain-containing protein n=1 Tax=Heterorhabditis bacteriophora TaxID=37862 RepID=A0A1I7WQB2_HETBA
MMSGHFSAHEKHFFHAGITKQSLGNNTFVVDDKSKWPENNFLNLWDPIKLASDNSP